MYRLSAIKRISDFRTVSDEAILILTKIICDRLIENDDFGNKKTSFQIKPFFLADKMRRIYLSKVDPGRQKHC